MTPKFAEFKKKVRWRFWALLAAIFTVAGGIIFGAKNMATEFVEPLEYVARAIDNLPLLQKEPATQHLSTPAIVRGIYISSWVAGTASWRKDLVSFVENSELNSVIIDVKDSTGKVSFISDNEKLKALGYFEKRIPEIRKVINELHEKNIYVIGRIAVFQDGILALKRSDLAIKRKSNGNLWGDKKGLAWVDPASRETWEIAALVAKEAEKVGFDEINFDYIRFPSDGDLSDMSFPFWDGKTSRSGVIENFFEYLKNELGTLGVPISADLFGLTSWNYDDLKIGQTLEIAAKHFDYVSPMMYPSHYPADFQGFKNPAAHPYEVIKTALTRAKARIIAIGERPEKLRPWIQDFDLGAKYDASMIKLQKQAIYDAGLGSWLSWDPANKYTRDGYDPVRN